MSPAFHTEPEVVGMVTPRLWRRLQADAGSIYAAGVEAVWVAVPDVPAGQTLAAVGCGIGCGIGRVVVRACFHGSAALNGGMFDPGVRLDRRSVKITLEGGTGVGSGSEPVRGRRTTMGSMFPAVRPLVRVVRIAAFESVPGGAWRSEPRSYGFIDRFEVT